MELQRHLSDAKEAQQRQAVGAGVREELVQGVVAEEQHLLQPNGTAKRCGTRTVNHSKVKVLPAQAVTRGQHRAGGGVYTPTHNPKTERRGAMLPWGGEDCPHDRAGIEGLFRRVSTYKFVFFVTSFGKRAPNLISPRDNNSGVHRTLAQGITPSVAPHQTIFPSRLRPSITPTVGTRLASQDETVASDHSPPSSCCC